MNWFLSIVKIAGASFPVANSCIQAISEIESVRLDDRIQKFEDSIRNMHKDMFDLCKYIYQTMQLERYMNFKIAILQFDNAFYSKFAQPLAILISKNIIKSNKRFRTGITLIDPTFIMYLCKCFAPEHAMTLLTQKVTSCKNNESLGGIEIQKELKLPLSVIQAVFEIYTSKGYGDYSKSLNLVQYYGSL